MKNFYEDRDNIEREMRELGDLEKEETIEFGFLENIFVFDDDEKTCKIPESKRLLSMADFLHGYCSIFARRLHMEYGYQVENLYDSEGNLIHSYCRTGDGRYVDIRGITSDGVAFFDEFADWLDPEYPYMNDMNTDVPYLETPEDAELYLYTKYVLRDHNIYNAA